MSLGVLCTLTRANSRCLGSGFECERVMSSKSPAHAQISYRRRRGSNTAKEMSDVRPRLRELALALGGLSWADVKAMAVQLGMEFSTLSQIEQQTSVFSDRLHAAMDAWLNSDPSASWKAVIGALRAINKNVLAKELEKRYPPTPLAPPALGKVQRFCNAASPQLVSSKVEHLCIELRTIQSTGCNLLSQTACAFEIGTP